MTTIAFIVAAYLIGSLSFAVIVSRVMGLADPRTFGSGNPGATNVLRTGKKAAAALTLLGDGVKGWMAVVLAQWLGPRFGLAEPEVGMVALAVMAGHIWPLFFGFRGGKGVATALGLFLYLAPGAVALVLLVFLATLRLFGYVSAASLAGAASMPLWLFLLGGEPWKITLALFVAAMIWLKHIGNIKRLLAGTEKPWNKKNGPAA